MRSKYRFWQKLVATPKEQTSFLIILVLANFLGPLVRMSWQSPHPLTLGDADPVEPAAPLPESSMAWIRTLPSPARYGLGRRPGADFIMWETLCNWFCLNGQPEENPPPQRAMTQAYSNPGYSSFPSPMGSEPSCQACGAHYISMAKKQTCLDCKKNFCLTCSSQVGNGPAFSTNASEPQPFSERSSWRWR